LLLSTFHANDSATAVPRLLDMGIEPFLLSSTLELIIAQRLVRILCEQCRYSQSVNVKDLQRILPQANKYFPESNITLYKSKGCPACGNTGYRGRLAIFELLPMSQNLRDLILAHPSRQQIWELARKEGARSFFEDGLEKVRNGVTALEELLRVASPPDIY
jgi:general secretion pathway protein E